MANRWQDQMNQINDANDEKSINDATSFVRKYGGENEGDANVIYSLSRDRLNDVRAKKAAAEAAQRQRNTEVANQKSQMINQQGDQSRMGLAQNIAGVRSDANSRGLLYSGLRQGAEQDARGQAAGQMAQYRQQVNDASQDKLAGLNAQQAQQGLTNQANEQGKNMSDYEDALERKKQGIAQGSAIGKGLGQVGGLLPF